MSQRLAWTPQPGVSLGIYCSVIVMAVPYSWPLTIWMRLTYWVTALPSWPMGNCNVSALHSFSRKNMVSVFVLVSSFCVRWLEALNTFGNCQRPVFSLGVSQHMHNKQICDNLDPVGHLSCKRIMKKKTHLLHKCVWFQMPKAILKDFRPEASDIWVRNYPFLKNYIFRGRRFSQCFIFLTALRCSLPKSVYANNYFE